MMIQYTWYVFESRSFVLAQISLLLILHIYVCSNWDNTFDKKANFG
jgi:hypothetical protein